MNLNSFLRLGFFLDKDNPDLVEKFQFDIDKSRYQDAELPGLIRTGKSKLLKAFEKKFQKNESHVIPLSGGLDSRAILACLLEFTQAKNIHTFTFGMPYSYDYDIGNQLAKEAGTSHISIPLNNHAYTHEEMIETATRNEHSTHLFHHAPISLIDKYFSGFITWSGFMGGSLPGSGLMANSSQELSDVVKKFFKKNTYVTSTDMTSQRCEKFSQYIDLPNYEKSQLTLNEQINFFNRQKKYIYYHVKLCGQEVLYPFLDKDWANFMLSVDNKYRIGKKLYKRLLYESFPKFFKLKTKNNGGLKLYPSQAQIFSHKVKRKIKYVAGNLFPKSRFAIPAWINYMPFGTHIREDKNFNRLIYEAVNDLSNRKIIRDIDLVELYNAHMNKQKDHADALLVLASLEYHLKSGLDPNKLSN